MALSAYLAMNEEQTRAFFRPLGWELSRSDDPKLGRWLLAETTRSRPAATIGFDSLFKLWRWCRHYTEERVCQAAIVDLLVPEYLSGDREVRRSIVGWIMDGDRPTALQGSPTSAVWEKVGELERNIVKSMGPWRRWAVKVMTDGAFRQPPTRQFSRLLNEHNRRLTA
jgi:hypothetical protein